MSGRFLTALLGIFLCSYQAFACQVPVFRYALERWPADTFSLLVTSEGPLPAELKQELSYLAKSLEATPSPINLRLVIIDLKSLTELERVSLPNLENVGTEPTFTLLPPSSGEQDGPLWQGAATAENLQRILDSPARQRCAKHLIAGETTVWFLVESGNEEQDKKVEASLRSALDTATKTLELPLGVIRPEDLNPEVEQVDLDNVLRSDVPLKISFVIERISREEAAEDIFLRMLVGPRLLATPEAHVVPVFGRGRRPGILRASQLTEQKILDACEYLCGACSCQVKAGNPGDDLLFRMNWDDYLNSEVITVESEIVERTLDTVTYAPKGESPKNVANRISTPLLLSAVIGVLTLAAGFVYFTGRRPTSG